MIRFNESVHVVGGIAPLDITTTTTYSDVVNAGKAHWIQFLLSFGAITDDTVVVTVEECTSAAAAGNTAAAFSYRLSSAVGTDSLGAVTAATASGVTITASDDNKVLIVDVDPATLTNGYPYVRLAVDPGGSASACVVSCVILAEPRYAGATPVSIVT
jgi:hypothetical protein